MIKKSIRYNLFCYGTLQIPQVVEILISRTPYVTDAVFEHWRAAPLPYAIYPGLVPDLGCVSGKIIWDISAPELKILDDFEGEEYRRDIICKMERPTIEDSGIARISGEEIVHTEEIFAYFFHNPSLCLPGIWSLNDMATARLADFIDSCKKWIKERN